MRRSTRFTVIGAAAALLAISAFSATSAFAGGTGLVRPADGAEGTTPIKHLVVIFDENITFDHYFGTYPYAANLPGETPFHAAPGTPRVNGLYAAITPSGPTGPLLSANPNLSNPLRLGPADPMTCDMGHGYGQEQQAANLGAMDLFAQTVGRNKTLSTCLGGFTVNGAPQPVPAGGSSNYAVMDYYDGNTVTALWNYAQHYAMSDNMFGTNYGPSTPGAFNVIAGQTYGVICGPSWSAQNSSVCTDPPGLNPASVASSNITTGASGPTPVSSQPPAGPGTAYSDADPAYDICSYLPKANGGDGNTSANVMALGGNNVGQALSKAGLSWGWFEGGFDAGYVPGQGTAPTTAQVCAQSHKNIAGNSSFDYNPHHQPFQYYASTANPMHLPPTSLEMVGKADQANHQYDTSVFWAAADQGNLPAVSYLKAPNYQDGHPGYSDPTDEQNWLVSTINHLQSLPDWKSTAVVVTYDDSDGWYDHVYSPLLMQSQTALDALTGTGKCGSQATAVPQGSAGAQQGRCGLGVRMPFLVISPWAKSNYVDNTVIDQSSVVRFIEENWNLPAQGNGSFDTSAGSILPMFDFSSHGSGQAADPFLLDPNTGQVAK